MSKGEWIISEHKLFFDYEKEYFNWNKTFEYKCSKCGNSYIAEENCKAKFCSNCGASMVDDFKN